MKRFLRLTRRQKTVRNWVLVVLIGCILYGITGFPSFTKGQLLRQIKRENLFDGAVVIYEEAMTHSYGEKRIVFQEDRDFLTVAYSRGIAYYSFSGSAERYHTDNGILVIPSMETKGEILAVGTEIADVSSAKLTFWSSDYLVDAEKLTFIAIGQRKSRTAISFALDEDYDVLSGSKNEYAFFDNLQSSDWRYIYHYTLTLYGGDGAPLRTLTG